MQGDLIPWTVTQQFQDADFASLSGARVVRIAVHPDMGRAGYGLRALELLAAYFQGELADLVGFLSVQIIPGGCPLLLLPLLSLPTALQLFCA